MERPGGLRSQVPGETEQDFPYKISLLREATYKNEHSGSLSWKNRGLNWFWKGVLVEKRGRQKRFPPFSCNSSTSGSLASRFLPFWQNFRPGIFVRSQRYVRRQVVSAIEIRKRASVPIASRAPCGISWTRRARHVFDAAGPASRFEIHGHLRNGLENIKEALIDDTGETRRKFSGRHENKLKGITVRG